MTEISCSCKRCDVIFLKIKHINHESFAFYLVFFFLLGKSPDDDVRLSALNLKPNTKIMMMGTREENLVFMTKLLNECGLAYNYLFDCKAEAQKLSFYLKPII